MQRDRHRRLIPADEPCHFETFDEVAYLRRNLDVAEAVEAGAFKSGREHYEACGHLEGRRQLVGPDELLPGTLVRRDAMPGFADLAIDYPDHLLPPLDRDGVDEPKLTWNQLHWRRHGYLHLPSLIPERLTRAYLDYRDRIGIGLGGFANKVTAGSEPSILDIACHRALDATLEELFGESMFLNFSITQFTSTERNWHQDDYLAPSGSYSRYCAAWIAVDDVHPDCGVFEFVPGSHLWPGMRGALISDYILPIGPSQLNRNGQQAHWTEIAEQITTPAYEAEIAARGAQFQAFHARRGDVLIWHGKLVHRGSKPAIEGARRPAVIAHYHPVAAYPAETFVRHLGDGYVRP